MLVSVDRATLRVPLPSLDSERHSQLSPKCEAGYRVPSWKQFLPIQIDGRAPLDVEGMTGRMEEVLERALRRL